MTNGKWQGENTPKEVRSELYKIITKMSGRFWLELELMPDARVLWNFLKDNFTKINICTAPVQSDQYCSQMKYKWVRKNFKDFNGLFFCKKNKYVFASPNTILIDDRTKNTIPWDEQGGIAILHKNSMETIERLKEYLHYEKV